jgi:CubicO group peptidase (beta-lactamase class C family)
MRLVHLLLAIPLLTSTLDDYFSRAAAYGFSGSVIVEQRGDVVLRKGYGQADRRAHVPATPETAYNIASLDKQFISAAILRLEELGKLRTTDTLAKFFDFVPADKRDITLGQVMSHTSGLTNTYWDEHATLTRGEFVHFILTEQKLESVPGTRWSYSNSGYILLERVIELASAQTYEQFLHDALFVPAGMKSTGFELPRWKPGQVAHGDFWTVQASALPGDMHYNDPLLRPPPFRVLLSTVDDLLQWRRALRAGKVLKPESLKKWTTPVLDNYAFGWNVVTTQRGTRLVHHGGSDSNTGMLATYRDFVDEDTFVAILTNSMMPGLVSDYVSADVEAILFGGLLTLPPVSIPAAADRSLAGTYGPYEIVAVDQGPLVLRTQDHDAMINLRFPAGERTQDDTANAVVKAAMAGDFAPLRAAAHSSPEREKLIGEQIAAWKNKYGNVLDVRTVGQRSFVFEGDAELQSYLRVGFERGSEILRIIHLANGLLNLDRLNIPPGMEAVLAPAGPGRWTTWDFKLGSGAVITREDGKLVIRAQ